MLVESYIRLRELMLRELHKGRTEEEGQGMIEYALIVALIAVAVIVVLTALGGKIGCKFQQISDGLSSKPPTNCP